MSRFYLVHQLARFASQSGGKYANYAPNAGVSLAYADAAYAPGASNHGRQAKPPKRSNRVTISKRVRRAHRRG